MNNPITDAPSITDIHLPEQEVQSLLSDLAADPAALAEVLSRVLPGDGGDRLEVAAFNSSI